jgi:hypothetical protein
MSVAADLAGQTRSVRRVPRLGPLWAVERNDDNASRARLALKGPDLPTASKKSPPKRDARRETSAVSP